MNESEILLEVAVLGEQVDQFLKSDVGHYLLEHAAAEEAAGYRQLKEVNADNAEAVRQAQNRVWRGAEMKAWLEQAVTAGLKAQMILEDRDD